MAIQAGNTELEANNRSNLGGTLCELGKYNEALSHLEKALSLARQFGEARGAAMILCNIGYVKQKMGLFDESLQLFKESMDVLVSLGDEEGITIVEENIQKTLDKINRE